jgi:hypothetical protein
VKATRLVLMVVGAVAVAAVAKKWFTPGGVYVYEVPSGPRPIGTVGTSTAGYVPTDPEKP